MKEDPHKSIGVVVVVIVW